MADEDAIASVKSILYAALKYAARDRAFEGDVNTIDGDLNLAFIKGKLDFDRFARLVVEGLDAVADAQPPGPSLPASRPRLHQRHHRYRI